MRPMFAFVGNYFLAIGVMVYVTNYDRCKIDSFGCIAGVVAVFIGCVALALKEDYPAERKDEKRDV